MKDEKRGDKYFIILSNGEVEISEERLKLMDEAKNDLLEYIEISKKVTGGKDISIKEADEKKLDFHVQIDHLCSTLKKCGDQLINEKGISGYDAVDFIINADIKSLNVDIANVFQRHNIDVNKYWVAKLEELREFFNTAKLATIAKSKLPTVKIKPEMTNKLITFKNTGIIDDLHAELKVFFPNKQSELLKALQGEQLTEILFFPHNQNKFVEVFRRLKYNGFILNKDTETKDWICSTFHFKKKGYSEPQPFNANSVWDNLNKGKGEPTKKERICISDWLPYKSPLTLTREAVKEKL